MDKLHRPALPKALAPHLLTLAWVRQAKPCKRTHDGCGSREDGTDPPALRVAGQKREGQQGTPQGHNHQADADIRANGQAPEDFMDRTRVADDSITTWPLESRASKMLKDAL